VLGYAIQGTWFTNGCRDIFTGVEGVDVIDLNTVFD
jgi:hypothetical protein